MSPKTKKNLFLALGIVGAVIGVAAFIVGTVLTAGALGAAVAGGVAVAATVGTFGAGATVGLGIILAGAITTVTALIISRNGMRNAELTAATDNFKKVAGEIKEENKFNLPLQEQNHPTINNTQANLIQQQHNSTAFIFEKGITPQIPAAQEAVQQQTTPRPAMPELPQTPAPQQTMPELPQPPKRRY